MMGLHFWTHRTQSKSEALNCMHDFAPLLFFASFASLCVLCVPHQGRGMPLHIENPRLNTQTP